MSGREVLLNKLSEKIGEKGINRSTKKNKEKILEKGLKDLGIDQEKFKEDLEKIKKQSGLEINLKQ